MGSAPRQRQGIAAGMLATARNVGMVLGIGMSGAILTTFLAQGEGGLNQAGLYQAMYVGFLAAMVIAVLAGIVSATRGNKE
jgi:MFS family permease